MLRLHVGLGISGNKKSGRNKSERHNSAVRGSGRNEKPDENDDGPIKRDAPPDRKSTAMTWHRPLDKGENQEQPIKQKNSIRTCHQSSESSRSRALIRSNRFSIQSLTSRPLLSPDLLLMVVDSVSRFIALGRSIVYLSSRYHLSSPRVVPFVIIDRRPSTASFRFHSHNPKRRAAQAIPLAGPNPTSLELCFFSVKKRAVFLG